MASDRFLDGGSPAEEVVWFLAESVGRSTWGVLDSRP